MSRFYNTYHAIAQSVQMEPNELQLIDVAFQILDAEKEKRHYHSLDYHIHPMLAENGKLSKELIFATLFHDIVYDPTQHGGINETNSEKVWLVNARAFKIETDIISKVSKCILATYGHELTGDETVDTFLRMDLKSFTQSFDKVLEDELMVRKEYYFLDWDEYKQGRIDFLNKFVNNSTIKQMGVEHVLEMQAAYLKFHTPKIALYPGSFKPFHAGHWDVATKAEKIFDKVIIGFATNYGKESMAAQVPQRVKDKWQIDTIEGGLLEYIKTKSYPITVIRGLRNATDLMYEQNYLQWLKELSGDNDFKFISIFGDKALEHISGTALRDLEKVNPTLGEKYLIK